MPIEIDLTTVKDIWTCSVFWKGIGYIEITTDIIDKIDSGKLVITEYKNTPLGEVIYLEANKNLN